uniref:F-box domain-containing protein n=1 Tax=Kalanchoe fedtschenkoi TaxID=63787 RepID=A0A7N0VC23_KALFE
MAGEDKGGDEMVDRISELPDHIREFILGYLPISDAVRTSALSRKWQHSWTRTNQLQLYFNYDMGKPMGVDRYFRLIGRILLSHDGPIRRIVLHPLCHDNEGDIYTWLRVLSQRGMRDLTILPDYVDGFELPSSIFHCRGLSSLTVGRSCLRNSLEFRGFPNLVKLELHEVRIFEGVLENVLSNSPLEILYLRYCIFIDNLMFDVIAPNLRIFDILLDHTLYDISFKCVPKLRVASFSGQRLHDFNGSEDNFFDTLGSLRGLEVLTFDCRLHKTSPPNIIVKKLPDLLENLTTVILNYVDVTSVDHLLFVFCIIRSSPNLQSLEIRMTVSHVWDLLFGVEASKAARAYLKVVDKEEIKTSDTLTVKVKAMSGAESVEAEIGLIHSILSSCPTLAEMHIEFPFHQSVQLRRSIKRIGQSSTKTKISFF